MAFTHSPKILQDGLVFYVDAANPRSYVSGSLDTFDLRNHTIAGSLLNGVGFQGPLTSSWDFDGVGDKITIPSSSLQPCVDSNEISISVWVKFDDVTSHTDAIIEAYAWTSTYGMFYLRKTNDDLAYGLIKGQSVDNLSVTSILSENVWYNIVATTSTTTIRLYLDGSEIGTPVARSNVPTLYNLVTKPVKVGERGNGSDLDLYGNIANIKFYNRALTSTEVLQNYNALKNRFQ